VRPAKVTLIGGGVVGTQAARMAAGLGADVTILEVNLDRMRYLDEILPANCRTMYSTPYALRELLPETDLLVGAVLIPGAAAPKLVKRDDLKHMRKGSVIVDVAVDQGGCIETVRPTTHAEPTYVVDGVIHYCVANMPGAVPRTSTWALTNATLPWVEKLARLGPVGAIEQSPELRSALNTVAGRVTCEPVAQAFGMPFTPPLEAVRSAR
jgi:alanine dehydrogenase